MFISSIARHYQPQKVIAFSNPIPNSSIKSTSQKSSLSTQEKPLSLLKSFSSRLEISIVFTYILSSLSQLRGQIDSDSLMRVPLLQL